MYVITVDFRVKPEFRDAFRERMIANARASRELEPGCLQFDVCADPANAECIYLYEVYTDRAAFDAHLNSEHFKAFDREVGAWVAAKTVHAYARLDPG
jgi:quinol monooxygenase YgiN